jgi:hypothetical protein
MRTRLLDFFGDVLPPTFSQLCKCVCISKSIFLYLYLIKVYARSMWSLSTVYGRSMLSSEVKI